MTRVTGFGEFQLEMSNRDPCSSFMMESAWPTWGVPLPLTCPSVCFPEPFDRLLGSPMVSPGGDPILGFFQVPPRDAESYVRVVTLRFSCPVGPYPGHVSSYQAAFHLTRRRSIDQHASHRSGCVPSFPICIEWGKRERVFCSNLLPLFSLSRFLLK